MTTGAFVSCQGLAAACIAWGVDPKQEGETRRSTVKQEEREESIPQLSRTGEDRGKGGIQTYQTYRGESRVPTLRALWRQLPVERLVGSRSGRGDASRASYGRLFSKTTRRIMAGSNHHTVASRSILPSTVAEVHAGHLRPPVQYCRSDSVDMCWSLLRSLSFPFRPQRMLIRQYCELCVCHPR
jgi:hypothetical protein